MKKESIITSILELYYNLVVNNLPEELKSLKDDMYIAGGSIASIYQEDVINDIDIYFRNDTSRDTFLKLIKNNSNFQKLINCYETYVNDYTKQKKVQFVTKMTGEPETVIETFDFLHCKAAYDPIKKDVIFGKPSRSGSRKKGVIDCIGSKTLVMNEGCKYPLKALERSFKFIKRGYKIEDRFILQLVPIIYSINVLDENILKENIEGLYGGQTANIKHLSKQLHSTTFNNKFDKLLK